MCSRAVVKVQNTPSENIFSIFTRRGFRTEATDYIPNGWHVQNVVPRELHKRSDPFQTVTVETQWGYKTWPSRGLSMPSHLVSFSSASQQASNTSDPVGKMQYAHNFPAMNQWIRTNLCKFQWIKVYSKVNATSIKHWMIMTSWSMKGQNMMDWGLALQAIAKGHGQHAPSATSEWDTCSSLL